MIIIAASLYLPEHVMNMWYRAWFYYAGDDTAPTPDKSVTMRTDNGGIDGGGLQHRDGL